MPAKTNLKNLFQTLRQKCFLFFKKIKKNKKNKIIFKKIMKKSKKIEKNLKKFEI